MTRTLVGGSLVSIDSVPDMRDANGKGWPGALAMLDATHCLHLIPAYGRIGSCEDIDGARRLLHGARAAAYTNCSSRQASASRNWLVAASFPSSPRGTDTTRSMCRTRIALTSEWSALPSRSETGIPRTLRNKIAVCETQRRIDRGRSRSSGSPGRAAARHRNRAAGGSEGRRGAGRDQGDRHLPYR